MPTDVDNALRRRTVNQLVAMSALQSVIRGALQADLPTDVLKALEPVDAVLTRDLDILQEFYSDVFLKAD